MLITKTLEDSKEFALTNGASEIIKRLMRKRKCSVQELAKVLGIKPQSFSTKLYRDRFTFQEVQMITYLLDAEVAVFTKKEGERVY